MVTAGLSPRGSSELSGLESYYVNKTAELEALVREKEITTKRLEAQRNELNAKVRLLKEEISLVLESGSHVGEVARMMGKKKIHILYIEFLRVKSTHLFRS